METLFPFETELDRQIAALSMSNVRLSLMSVVSPELPPATIAAAARAAAAPSDIVGQLTDGSIAILSLRSVGPDGGAGVEDRFLPRLQSSLLTSCSRKAGGTSRLWFRSIHRWAAELSEASDLLDALFNAPAQPLVLNAQPRTPPRRLFPPLPSAARMLSATIAIGLTMLVQGCAGAGLALFGAGAGVGAGTAVDHTLSGIAYKTFTAPEPHVHTAARRTLDRMGFQIASDTANDAGGRTIQATASERTIEVEIESITPKTTRMRVTADQDIPFLKDQATATEILLQTAQALQERRFAAQDR